MKHILVIGYGNAHRTDDAAGYRAALDYRDAHPDGPARVLASELLKPPAVEAMAQADLVIFLDASNPQGEPGAVAVEKLVPDESANGVFAPPLTPARALAACRVVYQRTPPTWRISVRGENYGFGARLSAPVAAALPEMLARLDALVTAALPPRAPRT
jgi:hydrogenase maturation protease